MIYYFSGTGNSKWVAKQVGDKLNYQVINIIDINRNEKKLVRKGEVVGFIFPIYAWAPPEIMFDFMKNFTLEEGAFSFAIGTCVSEAGNTEKLIKKYIQLNSAYSINMPNNYIISSDVDSEEIIEKKINEAKESINKICNEIKRRENISRINKGSFSLIKSTIITALFNKYARNTKAFYTEENCSSCGLCEKICPVKCIQLKEGKPVWKGKCLQCLACINRCPEKAIQYGKNTKKHARYYLKLNK